MMGPIAEEPIRVTATESERKTVEIAGAGAAAETFTAAVVLVLAIVGLGGAAPVTMMTVATIVFGATVLLDAGSVAARYREIVLRTWAGDELLVREELGGGIAAGSFAGIAGIVLGILALVGLLTVTLCAVALIVFGGALLFGSLAKGRLASVDMQGSAPGDGARRVMEDALGASAAGEALAGVACVVLGIVALLGLAPVPLVLIGLLGAAAAVLMSGAVFAARMLGVLRYTR